MQGTVTTPIFGIMQIFVMRLRMLVSANIAELLKKICLINTMKLYIFQNKHPK